MHCHPCGTERERPRPFNNERRAHAQCPSTKRTFDAIRGPSPATRNRGWERRGRHRGRVGDPFVSCQRPAAELVAHLVAHPSCEWPVLRPFRSSRAVGRWTPLVHAHRTIYADILGAPNAHNPSTRSHATGCRSLAAEIEQQFLRRIPRRDPIGVHGTGREQAGRRIECEQHRPPNGRFALHVRGNAATEPADVALEPRRTARVLGNQSAPGSARRRLRPRPGDASTASTTCGAASGPRVQRQRELDRRS